MKLQTPVIEAEHEAYFGQFISKLSEKFQPLQIFCFSRKLYFTEIKGCFAGESHSFHGDYCLLLITETATRIDYEVQDYVNINFKQGLITVICHGNRSVWEAIDANSRFFKSIFNEGDLLYSFDGLFYSSVSPFVQANSAEKALRHFGHRIPLAEGFLIGAKECFQKQNYGICTFMLHQVIEQSLIVLIRVCIAYRSEFHNLKRLIMLCSCFSDQPYNLFLGTTDNDRLFDVLSKSYSCARYKDDFCVSKIDAEDLLHKAELFLEMVSLMCNEKISALKQEDQPLLEK
ncbi:HEPN domain-containing protein [Pedobacter sp. Leaf250]|uniref:HEPN domain-containing protein n=1 Tax=Pedobacter sp. Leaf250 TaxID=2876559 RepID=UPI001E3B9C02|nr:HEPN domain-containing protein [Pedobacter sp. Leaf250]